ncbi:MAG: universal stress protein, partial [Pseudomonadota bacterium]
MKSLLVPVEDTDRVTAALNLARTFATSFGSRVEGVALRLAQFQAVGAEPVIAVTVPAPGANDQEIAARAQTRFDAFVAQVDAHDQYRWRTGDPVDDQGLGALARVYDAVVVGRPGSADAATRMTTFEAALFD